MDESLLRTSKRLSVKLNLSGPEFVNLACPYAIEMVIVLQALARNATDAMKASRVPDILHAVS